MIPKKIHYVWIGDKTKPDFVLECINTWKKYLPDYEIVEWNNERIKSIKNNYMWEAIKNKKWAFASDYIRLYALYHEGGLYLDTDVEITHSFDSFLALDFITSHELYDNNVLPITSAVIGVSKKHHIISDLLSIYNNLKFEKESGFDLTPNTIRISNYFNKNLNIHPPYDPNNEIKISEKEIIFPYYYFCSPKKNNKNYAIHHFTGSWLPSHSRKDKLSLFNKIIFSRFIKIRDFGQPELKSNEKIICSLKISKLKRYVIILKNR